MQVKQEAYDVGVLVGRFQVHELHEAHRDLIQQVIDEHDKVVIFLGLAPIPASMNNPLDFEARKQMILAEFPEVNVLYIKDTNDDDAWSRALDMVIGDVKGPGQSAVLYGGRDSFIRHYTGRYPTRELTQTTFWSGTEVRKGIAKSSTRSSPDFRAGVVWATHNRFPTAFQCVDVAILNAEHTQVLLGRKPNESKLRFVGGFSDPTSISLEADAKREVMEETGLTVDNLAYVGSMKIDDWRYRNEPDCIKTVLFTADYTFGRPVPSDDLEGGELRWVTLSEYLDQLIMPAHLPLMEMLLANLKESVR